MDLWLTIDIGKIIGHMTMYVTKTEATGPKAAQRMVRGIHSLAEKEGLGTATVLQKTMRALIGDRMKPKQEVCHLVPSGKCGNITCAYADKYSAKASITVELAHVSVVRASPILRPSTNRSSRHISGVMTGSAVMTVLSAVLPPLLCENGVPQKEHDKNKLALNVSVRPPQLQARVITQCVFILLPHHDKQNRSAIVTFCYSRMFSEAKSTGLE